jgi:hypothetical protein
MESNATKPARNPRVTLLIAGAVVAIAAVVYFSFFYPPVDTQDTQGTIGAAKKWHSEQITDKDVMLEGVESGASETAMADATDATELKNTASSLANAAKELGNRKGFDNKTIADLNNAARELSNMAQSVLDNKHQYGKQAVGDVLSQAADLQSKAVGAVANKGTIANKDVLAMQASINSLGEKVSLANKGLANKALDNKALDNKALDNKALDNKALDNKALDNKALDNKALDNKALDNKALGNKQMGNKALDNKALGNKQLENKQLENKAAGNKSGGQ